jgi:hypothetical protein
MVVARVAGGTVADGRTTGATQATADYTVFAYQYRVGDTLGAAIGVKYPVGCTREAHGAQTPTATTTGKVAAHAVRAEGVLIGCTCRDAGGPVDS